MNRDAENALLLILGLATAVITVTGHYTRYVKPSLLPWLIAVAVLLVALALAAIVHDLRDGQEAGDEHAGHPQRRGIGWLIAVPIVLLAFVVPPALGAQAAAPAVVTLSPNELRQPFPPLPAGRAPEVSVKEILRRNALDSAGTLNGRLVTVVGFTLKGDGGTDLARIAIFCCAADAQLGRLHLRGAAADGVAALPENTWLGVEGYVADRGDGSAPAIPTITVATFTRIDTPANTYSY